MLRPLAYLSHLATNAFKINLSLKHATLNGDWQLANHTESPYQQTQIPKSGLQLTDSIPMDACAITTIVQQMGSQNKACLGRWVALSKSLMGQLVDRKDSVQGADSQLTSCYPDGWL